MLMRSLLQSGIVGAGPEGGARHGPHVDRMAFLELVLGRFSALHERVGRLRGGRVAWREVPSCRAVLGAPMSWVVFGC